MLAIKFYISQSMSFVLLFHEYTSPKYFHKKYRRRIVALTHFVFPFEK